MAIYTVSLNFLENLEPSEMSYLGCILFCFTNEQHPDKLAVDKNKVILDKYKEVVHERFADIIRSWVDMLSYVPSSMEKIDVDLRDITNKEDLCLELCSNINGTKKMIVYSMASLNSIIDGDNCITYNGHKIKFLDRDEAKRVLNENIVYNISNSQVAGRDIKKSSNTNGNK